MVTLAIISAIVFALYLIAMAKLHGIQPSISDNYYVSRHPWTFTLVMWLVAFTMMPAMIEATTEAWQFTAFLSCAGIAFVGAAAAYRQQLTNTVHIAGAATAGLMAIVWAYTICPPLPSVAIIAAVYILLSRQRHMVYWLEVTAFATTYLTLFIHYLIE